MKFKKTTLVIILIILSTVVVLKKYIDKNQFYAEKFIKIVESEKGGVLTKEEVKEYFNSANTIAKMEKLNEELSNIYYDRAKDTLNSKGDIIETIKLVEISLELTNDYVKKVSNYLFISSLYRVNAEYGLALLYSVKALDLSLKEKNNECINSSIINLAENYYIQRDYKKAIYIYEGLLNENRIENNMNKITIFGYLVEGYSKLENYEKAYEYKEKYLEAISLLSEEKRKKELIWIDIVSAEMELKEGNIIAAMEYFNEANKLYEANKFNSYGNTDLTLERMRIILEYENHKEYSKSLNEYKKLLEDMEVKGTKTDVVLYVVEDIINISYLNKDYKTTIEYIKELSLITKESNLIIETDAIIDTVRKEINLKSIDIENIKFRSSVIILIFTMFILIVGYFKNKKIKILNLQLKDMTITDSLTNTYNKRYLYEKFEEIYNLEKNIRFIMIDIDYFKAYNDNYGHLKGDEVLIKVANIMKCIFNNDLVFRYGGEEFSIISERSKIDVIKDVKKLQDTLCEENIIHEYSKCSDRLTLSIGMECSKVNSLEIVEKIIADADHKLYKSKDCGRNKFTY